MAYVYAFLELQIPNDAAMANAILAIVDHYGWDRVGTMSTTDLYGQTGWSREPRCFGVGRTSNGNGECLAAPFEGGNEL